MDYNFEKSGIRPVELWHVFASSLLIGFWLENGAKIVDSMVKIFGLEQGSWLPPFG